ncbi:srs domain-containing protein [Neospora caninum Liverpool]|uniref:Srs domain-containing protein n=1 Tax=Neospora caninum (strain Liverpool) TaxID=572307 RepID=F0V7P7_NEOCL|nr:srs domain-containing protein [Neospora caninum Liverpool]CBZ49738.1 srs domain-containing protein [Neospora caninum Liverpool]CEL64322.1 TPA: SRS domain-containing protein [Neospora caninum Liverpool]|eukprot:XP_003879773.1 srs domain-containing protein [Neospora caninum Liverpool]
MELLSDRYLISPNSRRTCGSWSSSRVSFVCILLFLVAGIDSWNLQLHGGTIVSGATAASGRSASRTVESICKNGAENETTCTCAASVPKGHDTSVLTGSRPEESTESSPKTAELVFSGPTNTLTLICEGGGTPVPNPATSPSDKVCPSSAEIDKCSKNQDSGNNPVSITTLLTGENADLIKWVDNKATHNKKSYSLTIPGVNLPLTDKAFSVGCLTNGDASTVACKVTVNLVKLSQTTGDTVECAYGATSNAYRQQVTLSPTQNTLTLVCGKDSAILPTAYQTIFCSAGNAQESCSDTYQSIMPQYEEDWWTLSPSESGTYHLEIPSDMFPEEEKRIVVGCKYTQSASGPGQRDEGEVAAKNRICNVDVTIAASKSAASDAIVPSVMFSGLSSVVMLGVGFPFLN